MAEPLNDQEVAEVKRFFAGIAADKLFTRMEHGLVSDWVNGETIEIREDCHRMLHTLLQLKRELRDAASNKKLTERAQAIRGASLQH